MIFGNVTLREDSKAKGRWETNHGGEYFAAGVGGCYHRARGGFTYYR